MGHDAMLDERGASCATGAAGRFCSSLAAQARDLGTQGEVARSEYERVRVQRAVNWLRYITIFIFNANVAPMLA